MGDRLEFISDVQLSSFLIDQTDDDEGRPVDDALLVNVVSEAGRLFLVRRRKQRRRLPHQIRLLRPFQRNRTARLNFGTSVFNSDAVSY